MDRMPQGYGREASRRQRITPTPESIRLVQILLLEALDLVASHLRRAG